VHYTQLVSNLIGQPYEKRYTVYWLENQNLEQSMHYAIQVGNLDLFYQFQNAMLKFLEGVEKKRWSDMFSSFCLKAVRFIIGYRTDVMSGERSTECGITKKFGNGNGKQRLVKIHRL
jgi:hypothetical protein